MAKDKNRKITKKLLHKYRLVILNEETFEERFSFKLSRLNVFVSVSIAILILIFCTAFLIAYTPLREYIPGYSSTKLKHQATNLVYRTDSLEKIIHQKDQYFRSIQQVLTGDTVKEPSLSIGSETPKNINADTVNMAPSKKDSTLRRKVEREDKYSVFQSSIDTTKFKLFTPIRGNITQSYQAGEGHFAVDISTVKNMPVKAAADGTVIFAEWTSSTGYVIILEHDYGLISVYKHNSSLIKNQGDTVEAGEVIAMSGDTGDYSTGPHLHFELWNNGYPVDPTEVFEFE